MDQSMGKPKMDKETAQYLWALRKVNEALIVGLETAVLVLENIDDLPEEKRPSLIESLKTLISQSKAAYEEESPD